MGGKKKLAIFCDGTWNSPDAEHGTNIVRLAKSVAPFARDGTPQIVYYESGVGNATNIGFVTDTLTRFIGGALGRGLDEKITNAYRFLVMNHEPGDEVYVFGFSRGAYTARSLCGLIRRCGILRRDCFNRADEAMSLYRSHADKEHPNLVHFRDKFSQGLNPQTNKNSDPVTGTPRTRAESFQYRSEDRHYQIMYAGIFDTVGAMGLPRGFNFLDYNKKYAFHDADASSLVASIRHAIATDEGRSTFDVTPFANFESENEQGELPLNRQWADKFNWSLYDTASPRFVPYAYRPYQQLWFPGDHGDVGGGKEEQGLSSAALLWIAEGAEWVGLAFDRDSGELDKAAGLRDHRSVLGKRSALGPPGGPIRALGPGHLDEVAESAYRRYWDFKLGYRPHNLRTLMGKAPKDWISRQAPAGFPPV